ncbi:hypothetical protein N7468_006326 [Penicillium chermesinum]|uniref:gamma-glutamylcyclotransferase n=1 Tax=Penicillium chermesinum TaxID=63820 RepID=A0A9W9NSR8_9EURO|nr:uncharacterized protein N7468_006326 [Penicillium chermesinum]KAJ5225101.1 hypothetical protein N7468_006326 [Penicillium chermesinum]KAJ6151831.1 hypothetical protein N7470_006959 [Penicillium chermesinum]
MHINQDLSNCGPSVVHRLEPRTKPKHLYFAYGSNLSPTQMKQRCTVNPTLSSRPLAIAFLPHWRWLICQAGYANVLPPEGLRVGPQNGRDARTVPVSGSADGVYGVLYEMDGGDERILDGYEGVDHGSAVSEGDAVSTAIRPREQGVGHYNKWYVTARVVEWIGGEEHGVRVQAGAEVPVLVYVDEERVRPSPPKTEYIARMNRAMRESEVLGLNGSWLEEVLRPFIPRDK